MRRSVRWILPVLLVGLTTCDSGPTAPTVIVVSVSPATKVLDAIGDTVRLAAVARDESGRDITPDGGFTWSSSNSAIVRVDARSGLATAVANGLAVITAAAEGKTAAASLTVTQAVASVAVAPLIDTIVSLGDTARFTATVRDRLGHPILGARAEWRSSNIAVAAIDSNGLATAAANGFVTISANVGLVSASGVLIADQRPAVVSVSPTEVTVEANATTSISLEVRDARAYPVAANLYEVIWRSADTSVVAVSASGIARGRRAGAAAVSARVGVIADTMTVVVLPPPPPPPASQTRTGTVMVPTSVDTTTVYVSSVLGGSATIGAGGSFSIAAPDSSPTALFAMRADEIPFSLGIVPPAGAHTSSTTASFVGSSTALDSRSTAVALVYLTPLFAGSPPRIAAKVLELINSRPEITPLADLIAQHVAATGRLPDGSNAAYRTAFGHAVRASYDFVAAQVGLANASELLDRVLFGQVSGSGIEIEVPSTISTTMDLSVRNTFYRDVDVYRLEADNQGRPRADQTPFSTALSGRVASLPPRDRFLNITSISEWYDFIRRWVGPDEAESVRLTFTPESPRLLLYAYGAGARNLSADLDAIRGGENVRLVLPVFATAFFNVILPIADVLLGVPLRPSTPVKYKNMRNSVESIVSAAVLSDCLRGRDPVQVPFCMADVYVGATDADAVGLQQLLLAAADEMDVHLGTKAAKILSNRLLLAVNATSTAIDLLFLAGAVAQSEPRHEFDFSYNTLLGATALDPVSGDNQHAAANTQLAQPLVVRVRNASGQPVRGAWVLWELAGNGTVSQPVGTTDANGEASVRWTLGSATNAKLTARLAGETISVTFSAGQAPVASGLAVSVSAPTITLGQSVDVTVTGTNSGTAASTDGYISVSFPGLASVGDKSRLLALSSTSPDLPVTAYERDETIYRVDASPMSAQYVLVDGRDQSWAVAETNTMVLRVTPKTAGTFTVYARMALFSSGTDFSRDPTAGTQDQQYGYVRVATVTVNSTTAPVASGLAISTSTSSITLGQTVDVTVTGTNSGTAASTDGYISVSFPGLESVGDKSRVEVLSATSSDLPVTTLERNETIHRVDGSELAALYVLADGRDQSWAFSETNTMVVRVTPKATGTFTIYARLALLTSGTDFSRDPLTGTQDQQNGYVRVATVTVNAATKPIASGLAVSVSASTITLGQTVDVTVTGSNSGTAASTDGYLSVSFPGFVSVGDESHVQVLSSTSSDLPVATYERDDIIHRLDGTEMSAQYLLADGRDENWAVNETNTLVLRVAPKAVGTFTIYARMALLTSGSDFSRDPTTGTQDQQNGYVRIATVTVNAATAPVASGLEVRTSTSTITLGQTIDVTITGTNSGTAASTDGYLSVSFPALSSIGDKGRIQSLSTTSSDVDVRMYERNETIHRVDTSPISAQYVLVDGQDQNWTVNETGSLVLRVTPRTAGTFPIYARMALFTSGTQYSRDPSSGVTQDQQGAYVRVATVTVNAAPAPLASGLTISTSASTITMGQSVDVTVTGTNSGSAASTDGYISVSFPGLASIGDRSRVQALSATSSDLPVTVFEKNESIHRIDASLMSAQYVLADGLDQSWAVGETNTMVLRVAPKTTGTFTIYARLALLTSGTDFSRDPTSGSQDQQGGFVRVATVTVQPAEATELVANGGFESGTASWIRSGAAFITTTLTNPRTGVGYAHMATNSAGVAQNGVTGTMHQDITIPSGISSATLSISYYITSGEATTAAFDSLHISLQRTNGTLLSALTTLSNMHKGTGYSTVTFNLGSFAGQTVRLHFRATSDASLPTTFRIDDVSLVAQ